MYTQGCRPWGCQQPQIFGILVNTISTKVMPTKYTGASGFSDLPMALMLSVLP